MRRRPSRTGKKKGNIDKDKGPRKVAEKKSATEELLGDISEKLGLSLSRDKDKKDPKTPKAAKSWLSSLLGPGAMLLLAGLAALVAAFAGFGGPFKGFIQVFGKWGTTGGLKMIGKTFFKMLGKIGKFFAKFLKRIPIIGGLISFGFAYMAFKEEDYVGGVLDIVSGLFNLVGNFFARGIASAISFGIDVFIC